VGLVPTSNTTTETDRVVTSMLPYSNRTAFSADPAVSVAATELWQRGATSSHSANKGDSSFSSQA